MQTRIQFVRVILLFFTVFSSFFDEAHAKHHHKYGIYDGTFLQSIVIQSGGATAIQDAIDSIPPNNNEWVRIQIAAGIYRENVTIPQDKPYIFLEGNGREITIVTFDLHEEMDTSATFSSYADNIIVRGITFENSYNLGPSTSDKQIVPALAVKILGDKSAFYECGFLGLQDTIWDQQGRRYFYNCYIEGGVDFIFGAGQSFYEDCIINIRADLLPQKSGVITAQGRLSPDDNNGFIFKDGHITGNGQNELGRAYRPYSTVIFIDTTMDDVIVPHGWSAWDYIGHEANFTYAEINCEGSGSDTSGRVPWLKNMDSNDVTIEYNKQGFIDQDSWISQQPNADYPTTQSSSLPPPQQPLLSPPSSTGENGNTIQVIYSSSPLLKIPSYLTSVYLSLFILSFLTILV